MSLLFLQQLVEFHRKSLEHAQIKFKHSELDMHCWVDSHGSA